MKNTTRLFVAALLLVSVSACEKDEKKDNTTIFKAEMTGAKEVPPTNSEATGTTTLTYNGDTKKFTAVTTYKGLTPTAGHIHLGAKGENGPPVFPFTSLASPIVLESGVLTDDQIRALFKDSMYVNLHTEAHPGGEIRAQLTRQ